MPPSFVLYSLTGDSLDHSGHSTAHDAQTICRIDDGSGLDVKNAAVQHQYIDRVFSHISVRLDRMGTEPPISSSHGGWLWCV
jgi:hypothetical protein